MAHAVRFNTLALPAHSEKKKKKRNNKIALRYRYYSELHSITISGEKTISRHDPLDTFFPLPLQSRFQMKSCTYNLRYAYIHVYIHIYNILHRMFQSFIDKLPEQLPVRREERFLRRVRLWLPSVFLFTRYFHLPSISFAITREIASGFRHSDVVEACQGILNISYNVNFILCIHSDTHNGACVTYAHIYGVVPDWSRLKGKLRTRSD